MTEQLTFQFAGKGAPSGAPGEADHFAQLYRDVATALVGPRSFEILPLPLLDALGSIAEARGVSREELITDALQSFAKRELLSLSHTQEPNS